MRKLLYIPILHSEADLGSLGAAITQQSISLSGEKGWAKHGEVVTRFWQQISSYMLSLDPMTLRIYQDGMAAEGEQGLRIIREAAQRGSPNHSLLLNLVQRGAILRKTEEPALLLKELENILKAIGLNTGNKVNLSPGRSYRNRRNWLMRERDKFIARTINETLVVGERGVLFLGAFHDVRPYLNSDIVVYEIKELTKVRAYFQSLFSNFLKWQTLADYLTSPITLPPEAVQ